jgi:uncharacterized protein with HEPN domain
MSGKEQRLPDYLGHMIEAIDRIESYIGDMDKAAFCENTLVVDAVIRNIKVIGEASNRVHKHHREFADAHPFAKRGRPYGKVDNRINVSIRFGI